MKTIGLIGGTSWVSTAEYYRLLNQMTNGRLGGINGAKILLYSMNMSEFKVVLDANDFTQVEELLSSIANRLETAGADCILLCANTPHIVADEVQKRINIPLIQLTEVTAKEIAKNSIGKVALLGTKFTMNNSFFKDKLLKQGIETIVPVLEDRDYIHASIFDELAKGIFRQETKEKYLAIISKLADEGAEGVIFGCTEIPMFITQADCSIPTFDTTYLHASAAVDFALS